MKIIYLILGLIPYYNLAYAHAIRHIYNKSHSDWIFLAKPDYGNVYFEETSCPRNGPCVIKAGETLKIKYTYTRSETRGIWQVTDANNVTKDIFYSDDNFLFSSRYWMDSACYKGSGVSFDYRAGGDFLIESDVWLNYKPDCVMSDLSELLENYPFLD